MEPVSFAVGIIGLAGLFSTCLEAAERVGSWREYDTDYRALQAQYNAQKLRLEKWGLATGLQDKEISDEHNSRLDDPQTSTTIKDLLLAIDGVCRGEDKSLLNPSLGKEKQNSKPHLYPQDAPRDAPRDSKRDKLKWALGAKAKRVSQVEQFTSLVENLHNLIPIEVKYGPGDKRRNTTRDEAMENKEWTHELREILNRIETEMEDEIRRDIHGWLLGSASSNEIYEMFVEKRIEDTCDWVFSRPWFLDWVSSTFPDQQAKILWMNGPAGFGKSIICARIAHHLSSQLEDPLGHFFISSDFENRKDPFVAIRTWLSQILHNPAVFALVREIWSGRPEQKASRGDTLKLFHDIVTAVPRCTFVLDGLDECCWSGDGQDFLDDNPIIEFLNALRKAVVGTSTRILIVSRDEPEIRTCLADDAETQDVSVYQYKIRPEDVQPDVEAFSRSVVNRKLASRPGATREDIAQRLAKQCNGQFLWVKMQEDHLRSGKSQKKLEQAINSTPPGLEHTYDRNWMRISKLPEDDRDRVVSLLRWAAFAFRPLSVSEVAGALSISQDCDEVQIDELPDSIDQEYINTEILELCGSLIEVRASHAECDPGLRTVHLAHFSVKEYLLRNLNGQGGVLRTNASLIKSIEIMENTLLAKMCLCYVDCEYVWQSSPNEKVGKMLTSFRDYAAGSWHQHAHIGNLHGDDLVERINHLFDTQNTNWSFWREWFDLNDEVGGIPIDSNKSDDSVDSQTEESHPVLKSAIQSSSTSPLYYASSLGFVETTQLLLNKTFPVNETGFFGRTPLIAAARRGHLEIVEKLISYGADLTIKNDDGNDALSLASFWGHYEVVKLLLQKSTNLANSEALHNAAQGNEPRVAQLLLESGADIELLDSYGDTALHDASQNEDTEIAQILLKHGAKINCRDRRGWTPVNNASYHGFLKLVKILVQKGADVEIPNENGFTAMLSASGRGHTEVVRLLLDHGANFEHQTVSGWTAVNLAANGGSSEIVKLLVEKGADIEIPSKDGQTPLNSAATQREVNIVRLLIEHGANLTTQDHLGWTALNSASSTGSLEVVQMLLEKNVDVNIPNNEGWTPLNAASRSGNSEIVRLLLRYGANINQSTYSGVTPLMVAIYESNFGVSKLLVEAGADTNYKFGDGNPALMLASQRGNLDIVKLLLEHNADVMVKGISEETALTRASQKGHLEIAKLLLEYGAVTDSRDSYGWTPLLDASDNGHLGIVKLLIDNGAEITASSKIGYTALHHACQSGHLPIVEFLLESGADIYVGDNFGFLPLHTASFHGSIQIVKALTNRTLHQYQGESTSVSDAHSDSYCIDPRFLETVLNPRNVLNRTPLFYAAMYGHKDVVAVLLSNSSPSIRDRYGATPLFVAVRRGHVNVAKQLLAVSKEKSDFEDGLGRNLLWWAAGSRQDGMVDIVRQFAQEIGIDNPQPSEGKDCVAIKSSDELADKYCTVCARDIDASYLKCEICEQFGACFQCVAFKVECFDSSHTWKLQEPPQADYGVSENSNEGGDEEV
ncbi:unnamed protein product [Penicillium pancosmium]